MTGLKVAAASMVDFAERRHLPCLNWSCMLCLVTMQLVSSLAMLPSVHASWLAGGPMVTMLLDIRRAGFVLLPIHSRCSRVFGNHQGAWHLHEGTAVLDLEVKHRWQLQACRCHKASCCHQISRLRSPMLALGPRRVDLKCQEHTFCLGYCRFQL